MRKSVTPVRLAVGGVVLLVLTFVLLVPDRAHPLANLVRVPGAKPDHDGGGIYYVDVLERKASLLERLFPSLRSGSTLVQHNQITPPGVTDRQRVQADRLAMQYSQQIASAVALQALGYKVAIHEDGVRVALVYRTTHAYGTLRPGDVIVAVDGKRVRSTTDIRRVLMHHKVGDVVSIAFLREGKRHTVRIATSQDPSDPKRVILGVQPQPALRIRVPFKIKFDLGNVGGPSAGLAFALQILEARGRDVDHGYRVAATGELVAADGSVGPIGGVKQKTIGARRAHADVFLVPAGENYTEARKYAHGLRLIPVNSFQQALRALATLPRRH
jgi:PDZ domain-containing protein